MAKIQTKIGSMILKNPVILASGTFDQSICSKIDINKLGAIVTKTITLKEKHGNPLPHIFKTKYGWLNSVGLKNPGIQKYLAQDLPFWRNYETEIITSIGGETEEEYIHLAKKLNGIIKNIEVNISCPNVTSGGMIFGTDPKLIRILISKIRQNFIGNLFVKLSPNVTDITQTAQAAMDAGADGLTVANTFLGLEIDRMKHKKIFDRVLAGYCGPAIKPMALKNVWQVWQKFKCPILASGGIENADDALDFIYAGASVVQIGSANYLNPQISVKIIEELEKYLIDHKIKSINQIKGSLNVT